MKPSLPSAASLASLAVPGRLSRYLGRTLAAATLLASAGIVGLFAVFTFLEQLEDVGQGYSLWQALAYVGYSLPRMFCETVPYATLIGSLTGLGLLAGNSELIVMRAAGVSVWQIGWHAMKPALVFVLAALALGETLLPGFERSARLLKEQATETDITPRGGFWHREGRRYTHLRTVRIDGELRQIYQYRLGEDGALLQTLWAERARYDAAAGHWLLRKVTLTDLGDGQSVPRTLPTLAWKTRLTPENLNAELLVDPARMSIRELSGKISQLQTQGLNAGDFQLGFYLRLFQPLACLGLVLVGISFVFGPLREATMGRRIVIGVMVGLLFKLAQDLLSPASLVFGFPPALAILLPVLACIAAGAALLWRAR